MYTGKDKGFSMVEMIVVIAIMAVLVAILAPACLKYVEKSRKNADITSIAGMIDAAEALAASGGYGTMKSAQFKLSASGGEITMTVQLADGTEVNSETEGYRSKAEEGWKSTANVNDTYSFRSRDWKGVDGELIGTITDNGSVDWEIVNSQGVFQEMADYSSDFSSKIN